jgi:hypothetical protein
MFASSLPRTSRTKLFAPSADQVREVRERVKKADPEIGLAGVVCASTGPDHLAGPPAD